MPSAACAAPPLVRLAGRTEPAWAELFAVARRPFRSSRPQLASRGRSTRTQRPWVKAILTRAYTHGNVKTATRLLQDLARRLDTAYPSAAASVREGLDETLTVLGLGLSERLQRSLATTNAIESLLSRTRHVKRNVKRWRGGMMVLRWVAAGVLEAAKGFRRVKGCQDMPALVAALRARDARLGLGESSEMVA